MCSLTQLPALLIVVAVLLLSLTMPLPIVARLSFDGPVRLLTVVILHLVHRRHLHRLHAARTDSADEAAVQDGLHCIEELEQFFAAVSAKDSSTSVAHFITAVVLLSDKVRRGRVSRGVAAG